MQSDILNPNEYDSDGLSSEVVMANEVTKEMTNEEIEALAAKFENRTPEEEAADHQWAVENGLSFTGPGAIQKAIAATKERARKVKIGTSIDPDVLEKFKAKAERVGIPYQTLLNSVLKRYAESKLDIEAA